MTSFYGDPLGPSCLHHVTRRGNDVKTRRRMRESMKVRRRMRESMKVRRRRSVSFWYMVTAPTNVKYKANTQV